MVNLDIQGLRSWQRSIQAEKARKVGQVTKQYQEFIKKVFEDLVLHTPQWSGNLAAGWQVRLTNDGPATRVNWYKKNHTGGFKDKTYEPVQIGDGEAPYTAIERALPQIEKVYWNTKVRFENAVAYAEDVSVGVGPKGKELRPMHVPPFEMMTYYVINKYSRGGVLLWGSEE
jgi:hypothetical protein